MTAHRLQRYLYEMLYKGQHIPRETKMLALVIVAFVGGLLTLWLGHAASMQEPKKFFGFVVFALLLWAVGIAGLVLRWIERAGDEDELP